MSGMVLMAVSILCVVGVLIWGLLAIIDVIRHELNRNSYKSYTGTIISKRIRQWDDSIYFVYRIKDEDGKIHRVIDWYRDSFLDRLENKIKGKVPSYSYDALACGKTYKIKVFMSILRGEIIQSY